MKENREKQIFLSSESQDMILAGPWPPDCGILLESHLLSLMAEIEL
jgi:hypothetical protein